MLIIIYSINNKYQINHMHSLSYKKIGHNYQITSNDYDDWSLKLKFDTKLLILFYSHPSFIFVFKKIEANHYIF